MVVSLDSSDSQKWREMMDGWMVLWFCQVLDQASGKRQKDKTHRLLGLNVSINPFRMHHVLHHGLADLQRHCTGANLEDLDVSPLFEENEGKRELPA